jgi:hypothetical protein
MEYHQIIKVMKFNENEDNFAISTCKLNGVLMRSIKLVTSTNMRITSILMNLKKMQRYIYSKW